MNCLLCGQSPKSDLTFSHLLVFKNIQVDHKAIFTYNQAMKAFFSQYKFDGDFLLRKVFAPVLADELKKYIDYEFVVIPLSPER